MNSKKTSSQIWGSRLTSAPDDLNVEFCAGRDVAPLPMADETLLEYDIWTNLAHARMLNKSKIISDSEMKDLHSALLELHALQQAGEFSLDPAKEDVHINIEHYITHTKGIAAGMKIHSGRSRNDQSATDMRLYLRDEVIHTLLSLFPLIENILEKADAEKESIMPGFTHYQPAMITTAGHWLTSWSQALLRDVSRLISDLEILNSSPLGAAASFGTSWPIDREVSSALLGFHEVDENTLDCISSRGEYEASIASHLSIMLNHLSTISQDIILLSTPYYGMLTIDDRFVTGSSIMPQKRNPDFAEIIRSKAAVSHGYLITLLGILKGSMSGYNRDAQQTKYVIMDLFREIRFAPSIIAEVCSSMRFERENMAEHCRTGFMNSADVADWMAQQFNLPFRECYNILSLAVKYSEASGQLTKEALNQAITENKLDIKVSQKEVDFLNNPLSLLDSKGHTGGPAQSSITKMITNQQSKLIARKKVVQEMQDRIETAKKRCFSLGEET